MVLTLVHEAAMRVLLKMGILMNLAWLSGCQSCSITSRGVQDLGKLESLQDKLIALARGIEGRSVHLFAAVAPTSLSNTKQWEEFSGSDNSFRTAEIIYSDSTFRRANIATVVIVSTDREGVLRPPLMVRWTWDQAGWDAQGSIGDGGGTFKLPPKHERVGEEEQKPLNAASADQQASQPLLGAGRS